MANAGQERTYLTLRSRFYWKNIHADSVHYVMSCLTWSFRWHILVTDVFARWHLDIAGPLPLTSTGNKYILMCVDSLSKWPELIPIKDQSDLTVANALYDYIITRFGPPQ